MHSIESLALHQKSIDLGKIILERLPSLLANETPPATERSVTGLAEGLSGIALYLGQLYKVTQQQDFLQGVTNIFDYLINYCKTYATLNYSFMNGRLGAAYSLLQGYQITGKDHYLSEAKKLALHSLIEYPNYQYTGNSFANGRSGSLLVLLHIYAHTQEEKLLSGINILIKRILEDAKLSAHGIYWNRFMDNTRTKNGFANGNAGIAYTFLELGAFFQNKSFYNLASHIFSEEDSSWNPGFRNWSSLEKSVKTEDMYLLHRDMYMTGNKSFFLERSDTVSYAHGTVGIGLARIRAWELLKKESYQKDIKKAFRKICDKTIQPLDHSIGHGRAGYGMFCLEAYRTTKNQVYYNHALEVASVILEDLSKVNMADISLDLYQGLSGIGYFLLQLQNPATIPSLLLPKLASNVEKDVAIDAYPIIDIQLHELSRLMLSGFYSRTIHFLEVVAHHELKTFLSSSSSISLKAFQHFVRSIIPQTDEYYKPILRSIFRLENQILTISNSIESDAMLLMDELETWNQIDTLFRKPIEVINEELVEINPQAKILNVINADVEIEMFPSHPQEKVTKKIVILPTAKGYKNKELRKCSQFDFPVLVDDHTTELYLKDFERIILKAIKGPKKIGILVDELASHKEFRKKMTDLYKYSKEALFQNDTWSKELARSCIRGCLCSRILSLAQTKTVTSH